MERKEERKGREKGKKGETLGIREGAKCEKKKRLWGGGGGGVGEKGRGEKEREKKEEREKG